MKYLAKIILITMIIGMSNQSFSNTMNNKDDIMLAKGQFEVSLEPQKDENPVGRMLINKTYSGDLVGSGVGQMISKRSSTGEAVYYAIEEFSGQIEGKVGSFTLIHSGSMSKTSQSLSVVILAGSGEGELKNISGSMKIIQEGGSHSYVFEYAL